MKEDDKNEFADVVSQSVDMFCRIAVKGNEKLYARDSFHEMNKLIRKINNK